MDNDWTIIPVEQRDAYMAAMGRASVDGDIRDFARFLGDLVKKSGSFHLLVARMITKSL